jgi:hypothetical protein
MDNLWKEALWRQFAASMDMFRSTVQDCPDELWTGHMWKDPMAQADFSAFWYVVFHTLFWLDLYLSGSAEGFSPPAPYTLVELDPQGVLPERVYTRNELLAYLAQCRQKCKHAIRTMTGDSASKLCFFPWVKDGLPFVELLLDTMRHVQEHGAQLRMFLGQAGINARWIGRVKED